MQQSSWCGSRHRIEVPYNAGEIEELRRREREQGIEPDWEIESFMKASIRTGKRNNIRTDYTLRLLGLEVSLSPVTGSANADLSFKHQTVLSAHLR